jgi:type IV pilus assembly protein PilB
MNETAGLGVVGVTGAAPNGAAAVASGGGGSGGGGGGGVTLTKKPAADPALAALIPAMRAIKLGVVPYAMDGRRLLLACEAAPSWETMDEASVTAGKPVRAVLANSEVFAELLREVYGTTAAAMGARLGGDGAADGLVSNVEAIEADDLHRMAEQPTLINLVNLVILEAIRARASDVHVEPFERKLAVKYRIDGVLVEQESPPKQLQAAITSRIKIMSGMNIAERYAPQDGHISLRYADGREAARKIDIRVSTVPTLYGESVVMRILDKENIQLDLATLGMREPDRDSMQKLIDLPHGMVLVTGPTGSGKTTTLYAGLSEIKSVEDKIITIEDPVEYQLKGITQIPINEKKGLTFARGLRSILRHDPDKIMVGEIRDPETAQIAIQSALTGHLVFTTVHANNVVDVLGRFLNMGVEPYQFVSALNCVMAQRLVRLTCSHCRRVAKVAPELLIESGMDPALAETHTFYEGAGCIDCGGTGFKGRTAICELLNLSDPIREMILARRPNSEIKRAAHEEGMRFLRESAIEKVMLGMTTLREINKVTFVE